MDQENSNNERIRVMIEKLNEDLENKGLYVLDIAFMGGLTSDEYDDEDDEDDEDGEGVFDKDIRTMMLDGTARFAVSGVWTVGDVAWLDRILKPEIHAENKAFETMMPTEVELLAEKARQALLDGVSIFDIDLEDSNDEDEEGSS